MPYAHALHRSRYSPTVPPQNRASARKLVRGVARLRLVGAGPSAASAPGYSSRKFLPDPLLPPPSARPPDAVVIPDSGCPRSSLFHRAGIRGDGLSSPLPDRAGISLFHRKLQCITGCLFRNLAILTHGFFLSLFARPAGRRGVAL